MNLMKWPGMFIIVDTGFDRGFDKNGIIPDQKRLRRNF